MSKNYAYTGKSNLEVMQSARNYNNYLYNLVQDEMKTLNKKQIRVLDFGAGIGTYADILKGNGVVVDCVEIDPNGVEVLEEKGYTVYKSYKEITQSYDIVYSFNVLEHVENDSQLLGEMKSCVNESGSIIIFVPAFKAIFTKLDILVEHLRRYRKSDLRKLGAENSLKIVKSQYRDPIGFILAFVYRYVGGNGNLNPRTIWIFDRILFPISKATEIITKNIFGKNVLVIYKK